MGCHRAVGVAQAIGLRALRDATDAGALPVGGDNSLLHAPFFSLQWDDGPPLWNAYSMGGSPSYDNLQSALLYPPRWPFFFRP